MVRQRGVRRFLGLRLRYLQLFDGREGSHFRATVDSPMHLRYGENPHQAAKFYGKF